MIIECKKVKFYSQYDEDAFFECLHKIKSVIDVTGKKNVIYVTIQDLNHEDLCNLMGLFRRYKINIKKFGYLLKGSLKIAFNKNQKNFHINMYPAI